MSAFRVPWRSKAAELDDPIKVVQQALSERTESRFDAMLNALQTIVTLHSLLAGFSPCIGRCISLHGLHRLMQGRLHCCGLRRPGPIFVPAPRSPRRGHPQRRRPRRAVLHPRVRLRDGAAGAAIHAHLGHSRQDRAGRGR